MLTKKGFTLVELLIVIVIVGILAAVSIPMMSGNVQRARATEAVAALGAIRTQMRLIRAETGKYNQLPSGGTLGVGSAVVGNVPGFSDGDLDGTYFDDNDYTITAIDGLANTFTIQALGGSDPDDAPNASDVNGMTITINEIGTISY